MENHNAERVCITAERDERGWIKGKIGRYTFSAKVFDLPSQFGIDGGRVSKLGIYDDEQRKRERNYFAACIVNYDRGWDIQPEGAAAEQVFRTVLGFLETLPTAEMPKARESK